jgi:hypothetical protein
MVRLGTHEFKPYGAGEQGPLRTATTDDGLEPLVPTPGTKKPVQLAAGPCDFYSMNLSVDIPVQGDELKREDLAKIKNQFNR